MNFWPFRSVQEKGAAGRQLADTIKSILGYKPGNIFLYHQAFLHRSATQESFKGQKINNERLEFLGDAILDAVIADYLFKKFPTRDEGFLTEMRSKIVSRSTLNKLSQKMGIDSLILLDGNSQAAFRSCKGDAFEALIGAIYLDKGYEFTRNIILDRIIQQYFNIDELVMQEVNFKSRIIEWAQREKKQVQFNVVDEVGSGYRKHYIVELTLDGEPIERGQDHSIKGAEQNAAEKSWQKINHQTIDPGAWNG